MILMDKQAPKLRILMVEDDENVTNAVAEISGYEGIECVIANDGQTGETLALSDSFDLVILDIMLPKLSGLDILRKIRGRKPNLPVLMLTAKDTVDDKLECFSLGADDYMVKPFSMRELFARIHVLCRRNPLRYDVDELTFGEIRLNPHKRLLTVKGENHALTLKESRILEALMLGEGRIFTREELIREGWGTEGSTGRPPNLDVHIHKLRKKLEETNVTIETVRGVGFALRLR